MLGLQRIVGNRAFARFASQLASEDAGKRVAPGGRFRVEKAAPIQRAGRISTSIGNVDSAWKGLDRATATIEKVIYGPYLELLAKNSKAAGVTKKTGKAAGQAQAAWDVRVKPFPALPTSPRGFRPEQPKMPATLTPNPEAKEQAVAVADGLVAWANTTRNASEKPYAEMRSALAAFGGPSLEWRFGTDTKTEPDVVGSRRGKTTKLEVKHSAAEDFGSVTKLVREGRYQLSMMREDFAFHPSAMEVPFDQHLLHVEISNPKNTWPLNETEAKRRDASLFTSAEVGRALNQRTLAPYKGAQAGEATQTAQIQVRWVCPDFERTLVFIVDKHEKATVVSLEAPKIVMAEAAPDTPDVAMVDVGTRKRRSEDDGDADGSRHSARRRVVVASRSASGGERRSARLVGSS